LTGVLGGWRFWAAYSLIAIVLVGALASLVVGQTHATRVVTKTVTAKADIGTAAKLEAALGPVSTDESGKPQKDLDCSQTFGDGAKCDVYQRSDGVVIIVHA